MSIITNKDIIVILIDIKCSTFTVNISRSTEIINPYPDFVHFKFLSWTSRFSLKGATCKN